MSPSSFNIYEYLNILNVPLTLIQREPNSHTCSSTCSQVQSSRAACARVGRTPWCMSLVRETLSIDEISGLIKDQLVRTHASAEALDEKFRLLGHGRAETFAREQGLLEVHLRLDGAVAVGCEQLSEVEVEGRVFR